MVAEQAQVVPTSSPDATVLVVDDEVRIRGLMRDALTGHADQVIEAKDGSQALATLARQQVSLVLLDYYMPGLNGNEVCQRIRERFSELRLPVIMVTCNNDPRHLAKSLESGATDFIRKPFHLSEFRARVKTALKRQQDHRYATMSPTANNSASRPTWPCPTRTEERLNMDYYPQHYPQSPYPQQPLRETPMPGSLGGKAGRFPAVMPTALLRRPAVDMPAWSSDKIGRAHV